MLFNVVLFSSLLLSSVVLALPSGLGTRIARRGESTQGNSFLAAPIRNTSNPEYSVNWAGALWSDESTGTFNNIAGTMIVPGASGTNGSSVTFWVGLDGFTCSNALLGTGISVRVDELGSVTYSAWYTYLPTTFNTFPDPIQITRGDVLKLTVVASSPNSGTVTIENQTNGNVMSKTLDSPISLCGKDAEWGAGHYDFGDGVHPLADFGTVTFTNATAAGPGSQTWHPFAAQIVDMKQNGTVLSNATVEGLTSLVIQYV